jgi:selenide, water dikinase
VLSQPADPMQLTHLQHLVLAGGGHAHVHVLKSLAMRPEPALRLTVVSPYSYATYSGMVPGVLSGQYRLREAQIDVRALAARAGATFLADRVASIDPQQRIIHLQQRPPLSYDLLSLDIGSQPSAADRVAADAPASMVKPIEVAAQEIEAALVRPAAPEGRRAVVVGAGAGGCEVAFALAARLRAAGAGAVTVCDRADRPLVTRHPRTSSAVLRAFAAHGIHFLAEVVVVRVDAHGVRLADGRVLPASLVVWATGAAGPELLARSGLPVDERGFLRVGDDLRCTEYPQIFAAGDCATLRSYAALPKAGVYAVRQGPRLAANLRAVAHDSRLRPFRPQRDFLALLNTGDGRAIFSRGALAFRSRLVWRLKDFIDRRFIRLYERPPLAERDRMARPMVACGGCAAKVGADILSRVLARLDVPRTESVIVGLHEPDDAAVFAHPPGTLAVATTDAFPPFGDDLYLVGQVAANNAASDLYAMGAEGSAAVAFVCLPHTDDGAAEQQLEHFLRGALAQLRELDIPLVGGHTIAGEQTIVGFSMHGWVEPQRVLRKAGARVGDALVLTKPLGTGVVLAAARMGFADADWVEAAHASMLRDNRGAMRLLRARGVHACTDVTGFGLAGHLSEMLRASGVGAQLRSDAVPALPGALPLLAAGWRSSFHATNARAVRTPAVAGNSASTVLDLCFDPQTSGGLLAAVPAAEVNALRTDFATAGGDLFVIGEVVEGSAWTLTS